VLLWQRKIERSVAHLVHSTRWYRARDYGSATRKARARHCGGYGPELLGGGDVTGALMDGPLTTLTGLGGFRDAQIAAPTAAAIAASTRANVRLRLIS
jgi:hypothetical protein